MSETRHTCATSGRSNCELCLRFEVELWGAINRYVTTCGGNPSQDVYENVPRMQAVADVGKIVDKVRDDLVKGSNAAAAACKSQAAFAVQCARVAELERENAQLVADLNLGGPDSACCRARHRAEEERGRLATDVSRLRGALIDARGFLRGTARRPELGRGAKDLLDEADAIDRVLDGKEMR